MKSFRPLSLLLCCVLLTTGCAGFDPAVLDPVLNPAPGGGGTLDESTVASGLREALRIGTRRAVERTSRVDGFLANELIRISIPSELTEMADTLRRVGFARQVDELEVAMNRTAEAAAGEATKVFVDAITSMSIRDAFAVLRGGGTAATDYLRDRTYGTLEDRFQPIVETKMARVGLYRNYNRLAEAYNALPFVERPAVELDAYLTAEALDGLFTVLGQEERRIREDPIARTTELLRRVFGQR